MNILGISAYYHDSAAALIQDGKVLGAASEERFTRVKNDARFPQNAIEFLLKEYQLNASDIDIIVFYDKPWLKFERITESCIRFAPKSWNLFVKSMPIWLSKKLNFRKMLKKEIESFSIELSKIKVLFSEHHFSHVASSIYTAPFNECLAVSIDGVGEWTTASIYEFKDNQCKALKEMRYPDSIGLLYSAFTNFCGFKVNSGEYKLMGLAPYGIEDDPQTKDFIHKIKTSLFTLFEDGSIKLNLDYFMFQYGDTTIHEKLWKDLFQIPARDPDDKINQAHCNFALAAQIVTEEILCKFISYAYSLAPSKNLCLSGGVALNCVANKKIKDLGLFEHVWIHPAAGDAGGAVGAALGYYYQDNSYSPLPFIPYLGPSYTQDDVLAAINKYQLQYHKEEHLSSKIAKSISEGKIIGWFQDKMEWGPRALGNRSILASPLDQKMQKTLNLKIKFREGFRPFAPIVLEEKAHQFFELDRPSPYMQFTYQVKNYEYVGPHGIEQGLTSIKTKLGAITHVDGSARLQTVNQKQNPKIHQLISEFEKISGIPVLINTSFNVRGEPIICSPEDAIECFLATHIDILVLGDYVIDKALLKHNKLVKREFDAD